MRGRNRPSRMKIKYRPEIDGLRAVAVVPVVLFHAGLPGFSGGYIGVDIFFVISGYLITNLIFQDIVESRFRIFDFYERRARRILPTLVLVMLASAPFAYFWMPPGELKDFGQSVAAASFFASNILFWIESGYFDSVAELKPLLHTWSLAVEEQFYIALPLVLMLAYVLAARRGVATAVALLCVSSVAWMSHAMDAFPAANFYLIASRFWELGVGGLAALLFGIASPSVGAEALSLAGFGLIASGFVLIDRSTPFPSAWAALPVFGAVLILAAGSCSTIVGRILSSRPLVRIGMISYSLYLWHFSLFAFARIRLLHPPEPWVIGLLIILSVVLAVLTWTFIETPFRRRGPGAIGTNKQVIMASAGALAVMAMLGASVHLANGFPARNNGKGVTYAELAHQRRPNTGLDLRCDGGRIPNLECATGPEPTVAIWGDSNAMHLVPAFTELFPDLQIVQITLSSCPPFAGLAKFRKADLRESLISVTECLNFNRGAIGYLRNTPSIRYVVMSSIFDFLGDQNFWMYDGERLLAMPDEAIIAALASTMDLLRDLGKIPILVTPMPRTGEDVGHCLDVAVMHDIPLEQCDILVSKFEPAARILRQALPMLAQQHRVFSLYNLLCDVERCLSHLGELPLYRDSGHLRVDAARAIGRTSRFESMFGPIFGTGPAAQASGTNSNAREGRLP